MRLGLTLGYWRLPGSVAEGQVALAQEAERLGYHSAWVAEAYGSDAATLMSFVAARTSRIRLGSAVLQMPGRTPAMTAMTAATLDQLSEGRLDLGLGASSPDVSEGWHGIPFDRQLLRTREYVTAVRMALRRERLEYHGETVDVPLGGRRRSLKLTIGTQQRRIPILLAALGPRSVALAGEIADGWLPLYYPAEHVRAMRSHLEAGAARARRSLAEFEICPIVNVHVDADIRAARDAVRMPIALYVGGMGPYYAQLMTDHGFGAAVREIQRLFRSGQRSAAAAALPDALIDLVALVGPRETVYEGLWRYREAGASLLIAAPVARDLREGSRQLHSIAELAGDAVRIAA